MSKYLITVSWQDTAQPLIRKKETFTVGIEGIGEMEWYEICREVKHNTGRSTSFYEEDIAIDFMMKLD